MLTGGGGDKGVCTEHMTLGLLHYVRVPLQQHSTQLIKFKQRIEKPYE
jgi:hypothetical protein